MQKIGIACDDDAHCGKGSYCGAPRDITNVMDMKQGVCIGQSKSKIHPALQYKLRGRDVAQAVEHSAVKVWILLHG